MPAGRAPPLHRARPASEGAAPSYPPSPACAGASRRGQPPVHPALGGSIAPPPRTSSASSGCQPAC
eukprot:6950529-Prymnesium_polylepis.1